MAKPGVQVLGLCLGPQSSLQSPSSLQWPSVYPFPLTSHPPTSSDKLHSAFKTASGGMPRPQGAEQVGPGSSARGRAQ